MQEHVCKNCGNSYVGKYCNSCGEKIYNPKDKSILHFLEEGFHFITHFEGSFFTTLKTIITKPGELSLDYCNGIRKKYFKPLSFFLLLVVFYLVFPMFVGLNMPFSYYLFEKKYAASMITTKTGFNMDSLVKKIETEVETSNYNDQREIFLAKVKKADSIISKHGSLYSVKSNYVVKAEKTSKLLLFILIPALALSLFIIFFFQRKYFYDHLILATEICCFYLIFSFFIMPVFISLAHVIVPTWSRLYISELVVSSISIAGLTVFCTVAFKRFYKLHLLLAILTSFFLSYGLHIFVWNVYKYLLFMITLKLAH